MLAMAMRACLIIDRVVRSNQHSCVAIKRQANDAINPAKVKNTHSFAGPASVVTVSQVHISLTVNCHNIVHSLQAGITHSSTGHTNKLA
jgi:hypothetical protein